MKGLINEPCFEIIQHYRNLRIGCGHTGSNDGLQRLSRA